MTSPEGDFSAIRHEMTRSWRRSTGWIRSHLVDRIGHSSASMVLYGTLCSSRQRPRLELGIPLFAEALESKRHVRQKRPDELRQNELELHREGREELDDGQNLIEERLQNVDQVDPETAVGHLADSAIVDIGVDVVWHDPLVVTGHKGGEEADTVECQNFWPRVEFDTEEGALAGAEL